jgi:hypothetical protein
MTAAEVRSLVLNGDDVLRPAWLDQGELEASTAGPPVGLDDLIAAIKSVTQRLQVRRRLNQEPDIRLKPSKVLQAITTDVSDGLAEIVMNFHRQRGDGVSDVAETAAVLMFRLGAKFKALPSDGSLPIRDSDLHDDILLIARIALRPVAGGSYPIRS